MMTIRIPSPPTGILSWSFQHDERIIKETSRDWERAQKQLQK
jgi:hypothetical protein